MRASGAALLGAGLLGAGLLIASNSNAAQEPNDGVDFDIDAEVQLAMNYYGNMQAHPMEWSDGQLVNLENLLLELGFREEASVVADLREGLYGPERPPPEPLPNIRFVSRQVLDTLADQFEREIEA